jgi:hypothetical protein
MKRKAFLVIASILMIVIGVLRGMGGIFLYTKGSELVTNRPIIASEFQIKMVAMGLVIICILLIYSGIILLWNTNKGAWNISAVVLLLFLVTGLINGFVLFGRPVDQGQMINIIAVLVSIGLLITGKPALNKRE